jgi:hypothetical protein
MYDTSAKNTKIPAFLRAVTIIECLAVAAAALVLFFAPPLAKTAWVWDVPPFNSRYTGAIYFAALLPLLVLAISGRWSPGRVVLWMILTFTTSVTLVMLANISVFAWDRVGTPIYWFLYLFVPLNSTFFLYKLRDWKVAGEEKNKPTISNLLLAITVLSGLYAIALLISPATVTAFWPWLVDDFHGRVYAATFITPAVGAWIIRQRSAPAERIVVGLTLLALGVLSILGTIWTSSGVPVDKQVNYAALGTWLYFGMNALLAAAGFMLTQSARPKKYAK